MGTVSTLAIQPDEKHRLAVHEAGRTAAAFYTPSGEPLLRESRTACGPLDAAQIAPLLALPEYFSDTLDNTSASDELIADPIEA